MLEVRTAPFVVIIWAHRRRWMGARGSARFISGCRRNTPCLSAYSQTGEI